MWLVGFLGRCQWVNYLVCFPEFALWRVFQKKHIYKVPYMFPVSWCFFFYFRRYIGSISLTLWPPTEPRVVKTRDISLHCSILAQHFEHSQLYMALQYHSWPLDRSNKNCGSFLLGWNSLGIESWEKRINHQVFQRCRWCGFLWYIKGPSNRTIYKGLWSYIHRQVASQIWKTI